MKYRKLRIAFSVVCGILCLLLIALWVRSYVWMDIIPYKRLTSSRGIVYANQTLKCPDGMGDEFSYPSGYWKMRLNGVRVVPTGTRGVAIPYWLLIALGLVATGTPWIRWRFSLRTLLIGMTVVAVGLGILVWVTR